MRQGVAAVPNSGFPRAADLLDEVCRRRNISQEPILWTAAPGLYLMLRRAFSPDGPSERRYANPVGSTEQSTSLQVHLQKSSAQVGRALFFAGTVNQQRSVEPVIVEAEHEWGPRKSVRASPRPGRMAALAARAVRLAARIALDAKIAAFPLPFTQPLALRWLIGSARRIAFCEALIDAACPGVLIGATNHSRETRAMLAAAAARGIPSVYVPHAPLIDDTRLRDLPYDFAALRGRAEFEWYAEQGANRSRMVAAGDPSIENARLVEITHDAPVVVALSPLPAAAITRTIEAVVAAAPKRVVVAPHPAQNRAQLLPLCPPSWEVWNGRTYDLLRDGATAVVQQSSGVGLEALLLGLPTIEFRPPDTAPNYPFLDPAFVHVASNPGDLTRAIRAAHREASDHNRRGELQRWAARWTSGWGAAAAAAAWRIIRDDAACGPAIAPLFDVWAVGE